MKPLTLLLILAGVGSLVAFGVASGDNGTTLEIVEIEHGGTVYEVRLTGGMPWPIPGSVETKERWRWQVNERGSSEILETGYSFDRDNALVAADTWIKGGA